MSNVAEESKWLTHEMLGWERAWGELSKVHGDPDARDGDGEAWEYMGTYEGNHQFRHRGIGTFETPAISPDDWVYSVKFTPSAGLGATTNSPTGTVIPAGVMRATETIDLRVEGAAEIAAATEALATVEEHVRRALCGVLDRLGADGATAFINGDSPEKVSDAIFAFVREEEQRARAEGKANVIRWMRNESAGYKALADKQPRSIEKGAAVAFASTLTCIADDLETEHGAIPVAGKP